MKKEIRGFFLIDALLAATLVSILAFPVISIFLLSRNVASASFQRTTALALAQNRIEELKAMPFGELQNLGDQIIEEYVLKEGVNYRRFTKLEREDDLVNISVEILWEGRQIGLVTTRGPFEVQKGFHLD